MKIANAMARGAMKTCRMHPENGMCTHERRFARCAQSNHLQANNCEEHMHESSLTRSMCVGNTFASEYITDD